MCEPCLSDINFMRIWLLMDSIGDWSPWLSLPKSRVVKSQPMQDLVDYINKN